ncbi:uncharacterized protein LOC134028031 [Osmerus eperlanus]|uniref:uncharacterized protein LOC134028031 n=1 Tax=Osmerus eperlanus TaxID=29151 RepID=UPI002E163D8D
MKHFLTHQINRKQSSKKQWFCQFFVSKDDLLRRLQPVMRKEVSCDYGVGPALNFLSPRSDGYNLADVVVDSPDPTTAQTPKATSGSMATSTFPSEYQTSSLTDGTSAPSDTTESSAAGTTAGTTYPPSGTQTHSSSAKPQRSTRVDSSPGSHVSSAVPSDSRWVTITGAQMLLVVVGVAGSTVCVTLGGLIAVCVRWRSGEYI